MSLRINLEPGGIIWQARQHMAASPDTIPLDADASGFDGYVADMMNAKRVRDNLNDTQAREYGRHLAAASKDNPIGRQLTKYQDLPSDKLLTVNLTLLNESLGIMPEYKPTSSGARKIGRVTILLYSNEPHSHLALRGPRLQTNMMGGMDILSDGVVHMTMFALDQCTGCRYTDLKDESRILNRFDLSDVYLNPRANEAINHNGLRMSGVFSKQFTDNQVTNLQEYLHEQFSVE